MHHEPRVADVDAPNETSNVDQEVATVPPAPTS
jgi:hypothetical protein